MVGCRGNTSQSSPGGWSKWGDYLARLSGGWQREDVDLVGGRAGGEGGGWGGELEWGKGRWGWGTRWGGGGGVGGRGLVVGGVGGGVGTGDWFRLWGGGR